MKRLIIDIILVVLFFLGQIQPGYSEVKEKTSPAEPQKVHRKLDIVLVLDNSGSMKKNDPGFLAKDVVTRFLTDLGEESRLGLVVFDQEARLAVGLVDTTGSLARARFLKSLEKINYKGLFSNTPSATERAIYELKTHGRKDARKLIILLTDGIVDIGDRRLDLEREKWLKQDLAEESQKAGIHIIGIAFTDMADFSLIQTLALKTDGEYFRAYRAEDIESVFGKINDMFTKPKAKPALASSREIKPVTPASPAIKPAAPTPLKIEAAPPRAQETPPSQVQDIYMHLILAGILVLLCVIVVIMVSNRKYKDLVKTGVTPATEAHPPMPRAELIDAKNITGRKILPLNKIITKIGRDSNNDIAIPKETVSSFHAVIEYKDGSFYLEDQRSRNKTVLCGEEIEPYSPKKLKSGDDIIFNVYKFIFILPDLVPAGKTVMDFSPESKTVIRTGAGDGKPHPSPVNGLSVPLAMLIDADDITKNKTVMLDKKITKIGRGVHNDVVIPEKSVSGFHAIIEYKDDFFYLEDQRSTNKTFLNAKEIEPNSSVKLKSGDEILFDVYRFIFMLERQLPTGETDKRW